MRTSPPATAPSRGLSPRAPGALLPLQPLSLRSLRKASELSTCRSRGHWAGRPRDEDTVAFCFHQPFNKEKSPRAKTGRCCYRKMGKAASSATSNRSVADRSDRVSFELPCPVITIRVPSPLKSRWHSIERHARGPSRADRDLVPDHSTGDRTEIEYLFPLYWTTKLFKRKCTLSLLFQTPINLCSESGHVLGIINVATH